MDINRLRELAGTSIQEAGPESLEALVMNASDTVQHAADLVSKAYEMLGMPEEGDEAAGLMVTIAMELEESIRRTDEN